MDFQLPNPLNYSYVVALVRQWFPSVNLVDHYMEKRVNRFRPHQDPITPGSIVFLDDEAFGQRNAQCLEVFEPYINQVLIVSMDRNLSQLLRDQGHNVVYEPFLLGMDDAISMRHVGDVVFKDKFTGEYNFLCLNRRSCPWRLKLMQQLEHHNLLAQGYVTYHGVGGIGKIPPYHHEDLRQDDLTHYTDTQTGFERHNHLINGVWCTSNLRNYLYINEKFSGHTMISSETGYVNFVTEKSMIALFCKKMPMVFSQRPIISMLQNEGFDCFTDIIDHSYDNEDGWEKKIKLGISSNRELLCSDMRHKKDEIDNRTQANYQHLLTHWLDRRLNTLKDNISTWANS